jgi:predicted site-specific integrase-resolvase
VELQQNEKLVTLKEASEALGLPMFKFYRAAKAGQIPTYTLFNSRKYVKLREIVEIIEKSRTSAGT